MSLVGISAAAKALGKNKSTISRYIAEHAELNRAAEGQPPLVDLDELRAHREGVVDWGKAGNHAGLPFAADMDVADGDDEDAPVPLSRSTSERRSPAPQGLAKAKTARETIRARRELHEWEKSLKQVCPRRQVEEGAAEAGLLLQQALQSRNRDLAVPLAAMTEVPAIIAYLDEADRALLERLNDAVERRLKPAGNAGDAT